MYPEYPATPLAPEPPFGMLPAFPPPVPPFEPDDAVYPNAVVDEPVDPTVKVYCVPPVAVYVACVVTVPAPPEPPPFPPSPLFPGRPPAPLAPEPPLQPGPTNTIVLIVLLINELGIVNVTVPEVLHMIDVVVPDIEVQNPDVATHVGSMVTGGTIGVVLSKTKSSCVGFRKCWL